MKRTYQPSNVKRKRTHGFLERMSTRGGRNVLKRRRMKGRKRLTVQDPSLLMMVDKKESFKFPKRERLTHPQEFRSVMKFGRKIPSRNIILFFKENNCQVHRLGLVVSREVGSAAYRNRIKRFVREFFRHQKNRIRGTLDVVILVRKNCALQSYRETEEEVGRLLGIV